MKLKRTVLALGLAMSTLAAAPLPPAVVPGETPPTDYPALVADNLKRLGSNDPDIYGPAYDDCIFDSDAVGKLLKEAASNSKLDKTTKTRLAAALALRKPIDDSKVLARQLEEPKRISEKLHVLAAYESGSRKNPSWDDDVRAGLGYYIASKDLVDEPACTNSLRRSCFYLDRAIAAGCDDPIVLVVDGFGSGDTRTKSPLEVYKLMIRADEADKKSSTTPYVKTIIDGRLLRHFVKLPSDLRPLQVRLNDMIQQLKKMIDDPDTGAGLACDVAGNVETTMSTIKIDPGEWFDDYEPSLEQAYPKSAEVWLHRGRFYEQYAWIARGHGDARSVTPAMAEQFKSRLELAREALQKSWDMDPRFEEVPLEMMMVILGTGPNRDELEKWFKRGVELDPIDAKMYEHKMQYLLPRWYGSTEEAIKFGRECLATELYRTQIPMLLIAAHADAAQASGNQAVYYARADVWVDILTTYERLIRSQPGVKSLHAQYAMIACKAQKWEIANEQFKLVGDVQPGVLSAEVMKEFESYKAFAAKHTKNN